MDWLFGVILGEALDLIISSVMRVFMSSKPRDLPSLGVWKLAFAAETPATHGEVPQIFGETSFVYGWVAKRDVKVFSGPQNFVCAPRFSNRRAEPSLITERG